MEIILGIDNVVFISILAGKLPEDQREKARELGLSLALIIRIALLAGIAWLAHLNSELFSIFGHAVTGRDMVLLCGGLFFT
ncbi:MAG: hypothetical protein SH807_01825 [Blastochloris sp.]|jgi:predicted tellurium resistance membrane protein TerC|nr:hypothetical protein [Blastochloris sp.]